MSLDLISSNLPGGAYSPRFGMHTILWGRAPESIQAILRFISDCGFAGVELFQHPEYLIEQFGEPRNLVEFLNECGLTLIGLCSGSLEERVAFCNKASVFPEFLYVDQFDPFIDEAIKQGFTVAFHPHAYKQNDPDETFLAIERHPKLKFLLDPAHLTVMNRNPVAWLSRAAELKDTNNNLPPHSRDASKLVGVHLKDWGMWYGRSFQRYAQGFTDLGAGDVHLAEFAELLQSLKFSGWIIAEQDHMTDTADRCAQVAVKWIRDHFKQTPLRCLHSNTQLVKSALPAKYDLSQEGERVLNAIIRSQETPDVFWDLVVDQCHEWFKDTCQVVSLWEHTPSMDRLSVLATHPRGIQVPPVSVAESLVGLAVQTKVPHFVSDINAISGRPFSDKRVAFQFGLASSYAVPIWNSHNPNDVEAVLNFYFTSPNLTTCFPEELSRRPAHVSPEQHVARFMTTVADYLALSIERILADRVTKAVAEIRSLGGLQLTRAEYLSHCLSVACRAAGALGATIFLEQTNTLIAAATTGIKWHSQNHSYELGDGRVGTTWQRDLEYLVVAKEKSTWQPISEETVQAPDRNFCVAYVPIRDADRCIGVLRCRNKHPREGSTTSAFFTQSDVTVLQAICDAIVPRLQLFDAEERNLIVFRKMAHELKTPLTGINAYLDFIEDETEHVQFTEQWIEEARADTALMTRLITNAEMLIRKLDAEFIEEPFKRTHLLAEVLAPARDQMSAYLRRKQLKPSSISLYSASPPTATHTVGLKPSESWMDIPRLFLRKTALQQVFFNLFTNAIKYGWHHSTHFSIVVAPEINADYFIIRVRDWGIGIADEDVKSLFGLGARGSRASEYDPYGLGYGLAISRDILHDHGGDLRLTHTRNPTEFSVFLPRFLETHRP